MWYSDVHCAVGSEYRPPNYRHIQKLDFKICHILNPEYSAWSLLDCLQYFVFFCSSVCLHFKNACSQLIVSVFFFWSYHRTLFSVLESCNQSTFSLYRIDLYTLDGTTRSWSIPLHDDPSMLIVSTQSWTFWSPKLIEFLKNSQFLTLKRGKKIYKTIINFDLGQIQTVDLLILRLRW